MCIRDRSNIEALSRNQEKIRIERKAKIERYKKKKREWKKKISYDCRKRVADSRKRIKGRFISKKESEKIEDLFGVVTDRIYNDKKNLKIEILTSKLRVPLERATKKDLMMMINDFLNQNQRNFYNDEDTYIVKNIQLKKVIFKVARQENINTKIDSYLYADRNLSEMKQELECLQDLSMT
eukprot:TRINITY_DN9914_c0_g1_i5.p1 TRINITY_DN9914_c0_g1~~TRINITY_DN9914_c0_g1_i5.p1  ORF type:complete len:181 (+),score=49.02 TRINITY_DN9914_c0_g1_i5:65-607(+)